MSNSINKIDLHMHSDISSDGEFTPEQLMEMCCNEGIKVVALTDHNSLSGVRRAGQKAVELGITLIPAVELDCVIDNINMHLLGYFVEDKYDWFWENEIDIYIQELECGEQMMDRIQLLGINVDRDRIKSKSVNSVITGELIAEVALDDEKNIGNKLLEPYRENGSRSDNPYVNFYWDFCSQGKTAYVPMEYPTFENAVEQIKRVGGIAVVAHPGANIGQNRKLLEKMKELGVQGVEVYSSYHDAATIDFYNALADELGLVKTVGSDFHGKTKPSVKLAHIQMPQMDDLTNKIFCSN